MRHAPRRDHAEAATTGPYRADRYPATALDGRAWTAGELAWPGVARCGSRSGSSPAPNQTRSAGTSTLVVAVRARAVNGKANEALRRVLAAALGVRARDLVVVQGEQARDKVIDFAGPPSGTEELLTTLRLG